MVLINAIHIHNANKPGMYAMCEHYGQFIFGKIIRVTRTKKTLIQTDTRVHTIPKSSISILIFSESTLHRESNTIASLRHLENYLPNFYHEAFAKCYDMGIKLTDLSKKEQPKKVWSPPVIKQELKISDALKTHTTNTPSVF